MSRIVTVAATQMACSWERAANIANAEKLVRQAAARGAQIILLQELFETPYFCQKPNPDYLQLATPPETNEAIAHFRKVARELEVVLPISFFERAGRARFNSVAVIDADGSVLGLYRKSHIPDGPGYHEKYYFNPGDTGFTAGPRHGPRPRRKPWSASPTCTAWGTPWWTCSTRSLPSSCGGKASPTGWDFSCTRRCRCLRC